MSSRKEGINARRSYRKDLVIARPSERENHLVYRVAQARKLGLSYGKYMAQLHEGLIEDPMKNE